MTKGVQDIGSVGRRERWARPLCVVVCTTCCKECNGWRHACREALCTAIVTRDAGAASVLLPQTYGRIQVCPTLR